MRARILGWLVVATAALASPRAAASKRDDTELVVVPIAGGDNDIGLGVGYLLSFAKLDAELAPYLWRVESASLLTFSGSGEDGLEIPYWDQYAELDLPHLVRERMRLRLRFAFTRESTLNYYGLGNASQIPNDREASDPYFKHLRTHPSLSAKAEHRLTPSWILTWGLAYTHNWLDIGQDTRLAEDIREGSASVRRLLGDAAAHAVMQYSLGVAWDGRDSEVSPAYGQYHTLRLDVAPGDPETRAFPYRFGRVDAAARFFATLIERRLVLATRLLADLLVGEPPFYELPRYDETSAIGGINGVRGIPAQRYYGKIKLIGNLELRGRLFEFELFDKTNVLGVTGFVDAGRVWADYSAHPELDGSGLGLKYGVGAGARVAAGQAFVLRIDVAWSRDANPIAGYLAAGHAF